MRKPKTTAAADINRWFWPTELAYRNPNCWAKPFLSYTSRPDRERPPRRRGPRLGAPKLNMYVRRKIADARRERLGFDDLPF